MKTIQRLFQEESGQGLAEYGLILVLCSIATVGLLSTLGTDIGKAFTDTSAKLKARP